MTTPRLLLALLALAFQFSASARLAETRDQAEARYGLPKSEKLRPGQSPLIEGAKELTFHYEGWIIRCALLPATDGNEYIVREEYRKVWNAEVMKKGGKITISDFERDAVLTGEGGLNAWSQKMLGDLSSDPAQALTNQIGHISGLTGKVWTRKDGAVARMPFGLDSVILDLPQARKYEADLKAIKDQKARGAVPRF